MIGIGRVYTLDMGLDQLLASKSHNNFNARYKITKKFAIFVISICLHGKKLHWLIMLQNMHKIP